MTTAVPFDAARRVEGDHQHDGIACRQVVLPLAQLRQMLGAVQSPEPAQEDEHDGSPQKRRQRDPLARRARQCEIRCAITDT